jgi:hypothetical protein
MCSYLLTILDTLVNIIRGGGGIYSHNNLKNVDFGIE